VYIGSGVDFSLKIHFTCRYVLRDDHPYCIKCYENVFANNCDECGKIIGIDSKVGDLNTFSVVNMVIYFKLNFQQMTGQLDRYGTDHIVNFTM
jgi:hypothetical protein